MQESEIPETVRNMQASCEEFAELVAAWGRDDGGAVIDRLDAMHEDDVRFMVYSVAFASAQERLLAHGTITPDPSNPDKVLTVG